MTFVKGITCFLTTLAVTSSFAAANFYIDVKAGTVLPTSVAANSTVSAYYTIINQTRTTRTNFKIEGLPDTVRQDVNDSTISDLCLSFITLGSKQGCTLKLIISGTAKSAFALCRGNSCTTSATPLNISATGAGNTMLMASGGYQNSLNDDFPLLAVSQNSGTDWIYPTNTTSLPLNLVSGTFGFGAECSGLVCAASGISSDGIANYPLIISSQDRGLSWNYADLSSVGVLPPLFAEGQANDVSCSGTFCVSAGQYSITSAPILPLPLIIQSQDSGINWSYIPLTYPLDFQTGLFTNASCSASTCIGWGLYGTNTAQVLPLMAVTQDGGNTWSFPPSVYQNSPAGIISLQPYQSSCAEATCIAVGVYATAVTNIMLLALTTNNGLLWSYPPVVNSLQAGTIFSEFRGASCSGSTCIAAGAFFSTSLFPLLALTNDRGVNWSFPSDITANLPANYTFGRFYSASCSGMICMAAGDIFDGGGVNRPLIAMSRNGGINWEYPPEVYSGALMPPMSLLSVQLLSATCINTVCTATGTYVDSFSNSHPLVLVTADAGVTWSSPQSIISALPTDFASGGFNASGGTAGFNVLMGDYKLNPGGG